MWFRSGGMMKIKMHDTYSMTAVCIFLLLAVVLVFGQTVRHEFINYDDDQYVYENPQVAQGLTVRGMAWAFTTRYASNWHPLTWLTHMLDVQLYGLHPGGHHLTNVLLHAASVILLFVLLWRMTGFLWRSAFVAAVFAVHPLRAESVAWVAERKDVLSGLFFMLTIWAYVAYARRPFSWGRYLMVAGLFALGLMSKPMLVTLPFVLLLLDSWPLGRMKSWTDVDPAPVKVMDSRFLGNDGEDSGDETLMGTDFKSVPMNIDSSPRRTPGSRGFATAGKIWIQGYLHKNRRLMLEKIPLLVLAAASCIATFIAQSKSVIPTEVVPFSLRIANAAVSYMAYIGKLFYPAGLVVFYPHPEGGLPAWQVVASILALAGISAGAILWRRRFPYWFVGWFWYLGMMIPVIGLVQVGLQSMADRYTYLPQIGLILAVTWGAADLLAGRRYRLVLLGSVSAVILSALIWCAHMQVAYWRNSEILWTHAANRTAGNFIAHFNLGAALAGKGRVDEALMNYEKALEARPRYAAAHNNLGIILAGQGRVHEAIDHYRQALSVRPDQSETHYNLGVALARRGETDEAIVHFLKALEINPDYSESYTNLGMTLKKTGKTDEAIEHYRKALEINPDDADALNNLAWIRSTCPDESMRNGAEAVELANRAVLLSGARNPDMLDTLGVAYAEAGRFAEAIKTLDFAVSLASSRGDTALADQFRARIKLYKAGKPYRETPVRR